MARIVSCLPFRQSGSVQSQMLRSEAVLLLLGRGPSAFESEQLIGRRWLMCAPYEDAEAGTETRMNHVATRFLGFKKTRIKSRTCSYISTVIIIC